MRDTHEEYCRFLRQRYRPDTENNIKAEDRHFVEEVLLCGFDKYRDHRYGKPSVGLTGLVERGRWSDQVASEGIRHGTPRSLQMLPVRSLR